MRDKLLTTREVSKFLEISEKDVIDLTRGGKLPCFKVAGEFLRFKQEDIIRLKSGIQKKFNVHKETIPLAESIEEFFYFNDFYIFASVIIAVLVFFILKG